MQVVWVMRQGHLGDAFFDVDAASFLLTEVNNREAELQAIVEQSKASHDAGRASGSSLPPLNPSPLVSSQVFSDVAKHAILPRAVMLAKARMSQTACHTWLIDIAITSVSCSSVCTQFVRCFLAMQGIQLFGGIHERCDGLLSLLPMLMVQPCSSSGSEAGNAAPMQSWQMAAQTHSAMSNADSIAMSPAHQHPSGDDATVDCSTSNTDNRHVLQIPGLLNAGADTRQASAGHSRLEERRQHGPGSAVLDQLREAAGHADPSTFTMVKVLVPSECTSDCNAACLFARSSSSAAAA